MPYAFMKHVPLADGPGFGPGFPPGVSFLMLADHRDSEWALYRYRSRKGWSPADPASPELASLIERAKEYPPALALARDDLSKSRGVRLGGPEEMASFYRSALSLRLSERDSARYVRARARRQELGYLDEGDVCWLLSANLSARTVQWVSTDYFVYTNPIDDFEISDTELAELSGRGP